MTARDFESWPSEPGEPKVILSCSGGYCHEETRAKRRCSSKGIQRKFIGHWSTHWALRRHQTRPDEDSQVAEAITVSCVMVGLGLGLRA
jgi:hypothetical protein